MTKKFYEDLQTGELLTTKDLEARFKEGYRAIDRLDKYIEAEIKDNMIEEVHLSYEEIENLLTEEQNQITLETYIPYEMFEDGLEEYDSSLFFTVPYSWYLQYLEDTYDLAELSKHHKPKQGEDLDDAFMEEYTLNDTEPMYAQAVKDGVIISTTIL